VYVLRAKSSLQCSAVILILISCGTSASAQAMPVSEFESAGGISAGATTNDSGPAGIVPATRGFNASLGTTSQHDSSNGWSSVLNPNVAYRINKHFSADVGAPIYSYISIYQNLGTAAKPNYQYITHHGLVGDTAMAFHAETSAFSVDYNATVTMGLPSGNSAFGLSAGQVTYNINNHFEKDLVFFTPNVELGIGDSTSLVNPRVKKSYVAVGELANFQAGASFELPFNIGFEADVYENLPLTTDIVYSTTGKGKKKVTTGTNQGPAEDNGFTTALDVPLLRHMTLSGFYNRSLRQHDDVAGFTLTFLLKVPPKQADADALVKTLQ
jgi:hypothetical protein